jgi:hypothetical protein
VEPVGAFQIQSEKAQALVQQLPTGLPLAAAKRQSRRLREEVVNAKKMHCPLSGDCKNCYGQKAN